MPLEVYKFLHHVGLMLTFLSLGGLAAIAMAGEGRGSSRTPFVALHGTGLVIVLIAGFGWAAKAGYGIPVWLFFKVAVWLALGALVVPLRRKPALAKPFLMYVIPALGALAMVVAVWHVSIFNS